jgi:hypothetical protein
MGRLFYICALYLFIFLSFGLGFGLGFLVVILVRLNVFLVLLSLAFDGLLILVLWGFLPFVQLLQLILGVLKFLKVKKPLWATLERG